MSAAIHEPDFRPVQTRPPAAGPIRFVSDGDEEASARVFRRRVERAAQGPITVWTRSEDGWIVTASIVDGKPQITIAADSAGGVPHLIDAMDWMWSPNGKEWMDELSAALTTAVTIGDAS